MPFEPLWKKGELLHKLVADYLSDKIGTQLFCDNFEHAFNFDVDRRTLTPIEKTEFERLFGEVAYFSPLPREEWEYPGYRDEQQIRQAAEETAAAFRSTRG